MSKDLTTVAYQGFLSCFIGSNMCVDFLKEVMPQGFCESIYDEFWKNMTTTQYILYDHL